MVTSFALFGPLGTRDALRSEAERYVARAIVMIRRAQLLVLNDRVHSIDLLTARRVALCDHFRQYQRFKHSMIFDPVVQHGPTSSKIVARTMKLDCIALGEQFGAYHARWMGLRASEWPYYRRDMLGTVEDLKMRLEAELRAMRQLLTISAFYRDYSAEANRRAVR